MLFHSGSSIGIIKSRSLAGLDTGLQIGIGSPDDSYKSCLFHDLPGRVSFHAAASVNSHLFLTQLYSALIITGSPLALFAAIIASATDSLRW